ncbi:MAG: ABC transporter permease [Bacteroidetes bacterium]|nr:ABC transporter permease [Bacteroidota bacterium]
MLRNYIKIAIRSLMKNSFYTFINISGLAVGIASSLLILLWVADEYSFEKFNKNYDRIYKVYQSQQWVQGIGTHPSMPYKLLETLKDKEKKIEYAAMTNYGEGNMLQVGDKRLNLLGLSVSEDFFKIFDFNMLKGDRNTALNDPNSIVITQSTAKSFFNDQDPINQFIKIDNGRDLKVTGVIEDVRTKRTEFKFDYVMPYAFYEATQPWVVPASKSWDNNFVQIYVQLQEGATEAEVNVNIQNIVKDNNPKAPTAKLFLHPMSKWRLYSDFKDGQNTGGMIEYVRLFTAIAIFVLVIACINFMNLATARSENRAREVGVRKSVGSQRKDLIFQFLGESIVIAFLAFAVAIVLVELALPFYNELVSKKIQIDYSNPWLWISSLGLVLLTGIFAGSYPAFYLSGFQPVKVLKGKLSVSKGGSTPRQVLVVLQFVFSISLIIGTVVIYQQIMHVKARDMGYDRENLMLIWTNGELENNFQPIREELLRTGAVKSVCKSNSPITSIFSNNEVKWAGMPTDKRVSFSTIATEYDYIKTMGIKLIEGRDFSRDFKSDSTAVIVNQAAVDLMAMKEPLGRFIEFNNQQFKIIGVVSNIVMNSPYQPVDPMILLFAPDWSSTISVRLEATSDLKSSIAKIESVFKKLNPNHPFEYRFADSDFDKKFSTINLISRLAGLFASLAIAITCLGLFGLAAFTAEQRTKEIGIRKVLGASVSSLVALISKDFSRLVAIAFVVSAPLAWWFLNNFLQRYPYRVEIGLWVLPLAGAAALILTLAIVSTQALKAATSNPSQSLRSE